MAPRRVLDRVVLLPLAVKPYVRIFKPQHGDVLTPTPNVYANGRLSLKGGMPQGVTAADAWYIAETLRGAAWESVLRAVEPDPAGGVELDPDELALSAAQWVEPIGPGVILVIRLEPAARRHVIGLRNHQLNRYWDEVLAHEWYEITSTAAGMLQLHCLAEPTPVILPGVSWRSRQADADIVYVFYAPPFDRTQWRALGKPISLGSDEGRQLLRDVLAQDQMVWLNDPGISGGRPPAGAV
jgi:hypothetical protein